MCACVGWEIEMEYYNMFLLCASDYVWCMLNNFSLALFSKLVFVRDVWPQIWVFRFGFSQVRVNLSLLQLALF